MEKEKYKMLNNVFHVTKEFLDMIKLPDPGNKRLNYLLVVPQMAMSDDTVYVYSVGFGIVVSAIKASGRNVFTLNLNYKDNAEQLLRQTIIENHIDVVATGGLSQQYDAVKFILDIAKSVDSKIISIVGGGMITADPAVAMEALQIADYGVIGEGEITLNELAFALESGQDPIAENIHGLVSKDLKITSPREELIDLDCLPFPDYEGLEYLSSIHRKYVVGGLAAQGLYIVRSRSCPYNCTFCFHPSGTKYRKRSIENLFLELDWLIENYDIKSVVFLDELFINDLTFIEKFCDRIKPYDISYSISARVDSINEHIAHLLKDSGCAIVGFGIESADNGILKSMNKNITIEKIEDTMSICKKVGLNFTGSIILGDRKETKESYFKSLNWWYRNRKYGFPLGLILYSQAAFSIRMP